MKQKVKPQPEKALVVTIDYGDVKVPYLSISNEKRKAISYLAENNLVGEACVAIRFDLVDKKDAGMMQLPAYKGED